MSGAKCKINFWPHYETFQSWFLKLKLAEFSLLSSCFKLKEIYNNVDSLGLKQAYQQISNEKSLPRFLPTPFWIDESRHNTLNIGNSHTQELNVSTVPGWINKKIQFVVSAGYADNARPASADGACALRTATLTQLSAFKREIWFVIRSMVPALKTDQH